MNTKSTINLLNSKLRMCKFGYDKAVEQEDYVEASKWRIIYHRTKERIKTLKQEL